MCLWSIMILLFIVILFQTVLLDIILYGIPNRENLTFREAFKNKNDETYGIFHMLVDPPPLPTYGKFFRDFFIV